MKSIIGVSTWSLQQLSFTEGANLQDIITMTVQSGAEGIDICEEYIPCHPSPDLVKIREIRRLVEESGLKMGASWFGTEISAGIKAGGEQRVLDVYKRNIVTAAELGASYVCIPLLLNLREMTYEQTRDQLIHFLEQLLPFAEQYQMPIAHECPRERTSGMALELAKYFGSKYYTICPDFEAWRFDTPDLPLGAHCDAPDAEAPKPEPIELFRSCMPYAPYIHFKVLSLDEHGEEPHFPIADLMDCINRSPIDHYLCIEYEGWIPEIHPERNSFVETKRCVELIKKYQDAALF